MEQEINEENRVFVYAKASELLKIMRTPFDRKNIAKELSKN
jgi:hypothetical protein